MDKNELRETDCTAETFPADPPRETVIMVGPSLSEEGKAIIRKPVGKNMDVVASFEEASARLTLSLNLHHEDIFKPGIEALLRQIRRTRSHCASQSATTTP